MRGRDLGGNNHFHALKVAGVLLGFVVLVLKGGGRDEFFMQVEWAWPKLFNKQMACLPLGFPSRPRIRVTNLSRRVLVPTMWLTFRACLRFCQLSFLCPSDCCSHFAAPMFPLLSSSNQNSLDYLGVFRRGYSLVVCLEHQNGNPFSTTPNDNPIWAPFETAKRVGWGLPMRQAHFDLNPQFFGMANSLSGFRETDSPQAWPDPWPHLEANAWRGCNKRVPACAEGQPCAASEKCPCSLPKGHPMTP